MLYRLYVNALSISSVVTTTFVVGLAELKAMTITVWTKWNHGLGLFDDNYLCRMVDRTQVTPNFPAVTNDIATTTAILPEKDSNKNWTWPETQLVFS